MSKNLEYKLPLSHVIADYKVKLDNAVKHPKITEGDKKLINNKLRLFNIG